MEVLISRFDGGEKTLKEFCREEGISKSTFEYWRRKLRAKPSVSSGFQQILPASNLSRQGREQIRLSLSKGMILELPVDYPAKELLKILRGLSC